MLQSQYSIISASVLSAPMTRHGHVLSTGSEHLARQVSKSPRREVKFSPTKTFKHVDEDVRQSSSPVSVIQSSQLVSVARGEMRAL